MSISLALVWSALCWGTPDGGVPAPTPTIVTAEVVATTSSPCGLRLKVVSVEFSPNDAGILPPSGPTLEAVTSCYTLDLHQMRRGGLFRFQLTSKPDGTKVASVMGGLLNPPPSTVRPPETPDASR